MVQTEESEKDGKTDKYIVIAFRKFPVIDVAVVVWCNIWRFSRWIYAKSGRTGCPCGCHWAGCRRLFGRHTLYGTHANFLFKSHADRNYAV
jgi:hypothetical protein